MKLPGLRLRLATSQLIRQWAQRQLPNGKIISGQILNPKTMNYQTLKPEKDGLFCERIFGPVHDSICACGRQPLRGQKFCPRCEVEYISTRVRRYRLGYIQLITAAAHIWFFKGRPSYFSLFLNLPKKKIECLLYCTRNISRTIFPRELESLNFYSIQSTKTHLNIQSIGLPHPRPIKANRKVRVKAYLRNLIEQNFLFWSFTSEKAYWRFNKNITKFQSIQRIRMSQIVPSETPNRFSVLILFLNILRVQCRSMGTRGQPKTKTKTKTKTIGLNSKKMALHGVWIFHPWAMPRPNALLRAAMLEVHRAPTAKGPWYRVLAWEMQFISSRTLFYCFSLEKFVFAQLKIQFNWLKDPKINLSYTGRKFNFYNQLEIIPRNDFKTQFQKKSQWQKGGLRDSALYFGFSIISKMLSWQMTAHWFSFVYFLIQSPQKGDVVNRFYQGPPGLCTSCTMDLPFGNAARLFCLTGVQLMRTWLTQLTQYQCQDGRLLEIQIRLDLLQLERCAPLSDNEFVQRILLLRRFKYLRSFRHTQMNPASMILSVLPVLPPDLRPIIQLDNNQIAVSDLNKLYQTVLLRNKRLSRLTLSAGDFHCLNSEALQYAQRLLQESVDELMENGHRESQSHKSLRTNPKGAGLKSLSNLFKGKKGRFRQNLLGKRVDYSGRSVIVVGPYLKIYECGLPKEIAYELFQPFILRILMFQNQAHTILGAKKLFQQKPKFIWSLLKDIVSSHPILLNRAPTLHRLSIQAFQPRLIEGKAILLHPLVCAAFNADFDGDQMGVHLPLCFEARAEAWKITWSQNNLFSVATGSPSCSPSQDMILGSTFLTAQNRQQLGFNFLKTSTLYKKTKLGFLKGQQNYPIEIDQFDLLKQTPIGNQTVSSSGIPLSLLTALIQKRNLLKSLLFKKPFFLKTGESPKISTLPSNTHREAMPRDGTLPSINSISFSQKSHPFCHGVCLPSFLPWHREAMLAEQKPQKVGMNTMMLAKSQPGSWESMSEYQLFNQTSIWCTYNPLFHQFETEKKNQKLIEIRINLHGQFQKFRSQFFQQYHSSGAEVLRKFRTTYGRIQFSESLSLF